MATRSPSDRRAGGIRSTLLPIAGPCNKTDDCHGIRRRPHARAIIQPSREQLMTTNHAQRIQRLVSNFSAHELEAIALLPGPNLRYFTGLSFHLMGRPTLAILTVDQPPFLLVPELERSKAEGNTIGAQVAT